MCRPHLLFDACFLGQYVGSCVAAGGQPGSRAFCVRGPSNGRVRYAGKGDALAQQPSHENSHPHSHEQLALPRVTPILTHTHRTLWCMVLALFTSSFPPPPASGVVLRLHPHLWPSYLPSPLPCTPAHLLPLPPPISRHTAPASFGCTPLLWPSHVPSPLPCTPTLPPPAPLHSLCWTTPTS